MKPCVRHWKVHYGGFWHHFLDFRRLPIARLHWGYDGIVELVANSKPAVRRTSWEAILREANGAKPVLVRERTGGLEAIYYRTSRKLHWNFYNFFFYNCEHFANECMIGRRKSPQVRTRTTQAFASVGTGVAGVMLLQHPEMGWYAASSGLACAVFAWLFASFVIRTMLSLRRMRRLRERRMALESSVNVSLA